MCLILCDTHISFLHHNARPHIVLVTRFLLRRYNRAMLLVRICTQRNTYGMKSKEDSLGAAKVDNCSLLSVGDPKDVYQLSCSFHAHKMCPLSTPMVGTHGIRKSLCENTYKKHYTDSCNWACTEYSRPPILMSWFVLVCLGDL